MSSSSSKLTKKYQATIPEPVRRCLELKAGDTVVFEVDGEEVRLRKAHPLDLVFAQGLSESLSEWMSEEDEAAYGDL